MGFTAPSGHDMIRKTVFEARESHGRGQKKHSASPPYRGAIPRKEWGVARLDGRVVFIPGTIRGEDWEVQLLKVNKGVAWGKGTRLISPSPVRQEPDCPTAGGAGGCQYRHMSYEGGAGGQGPAGAGRPGAGGRRPSGTASGAGGGVPPALPQQGAVPCLPRKVRAVHRLFTAPGAMTWWTRRTACSSRRRIRPCVWPSKGWMEDFQIPAYDECTGRGLIRHLYIRTNRAGKPCAA